jgi:hypothetical protein
MKKGAAAYYAIPRTVAAGGAKVQCQFPKAVGLTPTGVSCCDAQNDKDNDDRCDSAVGAWTNASWSAMNFMITDQH